MPGFFYALPGRERPVSSALAASRAGILLEIPPQAAARKACAAWHCDYILSFRTLSRRCAVGLLSGDPLASSTETVV